MLWFASIKRWRLWSEEGVAVDNFWPNFAQPSCPLLSIKSPAQLHSAPLKGHRCKLATADASVCQLFFSYEYTWPQLQLFQWWWWGKMAPTHNRLPHSHQRCQGAEWCCCSLHMFSWGGHTGGRMCSALTSSRPPSYSRHCAAAAPCCLCLILDVHVTTTWYHRPPLISEKSEGTRDTEGSVSFKEPQAFFSE